MSDILTNQIIEVILSLLLLLNFIFFKLIKFDPNKNFLFRVYDKFFMGVMLILSLLFYGIWAIFIFLTFKNKTSFEGNYWLLGGTIFLTLYLSNKSKRKING